MTGPASAVPGPASVPVAARTRNAPLTFRGNLGVARHGWIRLTPAYSMRLVAERVAALPAGSVVLDPFCGTGTTAVCAVERGHVGQVVDVNPFLLWLATAKTRSYPVDVRVDAVRALACLDSAAGELLTGGPVTGGPVTGGPVTGGPVTGGPVTGGVVTGGVVAGEHGPSGSGPSGSGTAAPGPGEGLWRPPLFRIERWWSPPALRALTAIRAALDALEEEVSLPAPVAAVPAPRPEARRAPGRPPGDPALDLLTIAFCRTLIGVSNAAFNHQSMSFRTDQPAAPGGPVAEADGSAAQDAAARAVLARYHDEAMEIIETAASPVPGRARVLAGDARALAVPPLEPCDLLYTSPPYVNRMSYVRELRPYMYWLRFLDDAAGAGELDWTAIGGTWGVATSRVGTWRGEAGAEPPLGADYAETLERIAAADGRNATLLANYVRKYFTDMWAHFRRAHDVVRPGGQATYIIGNSTFFGHVVPAQRWYADLLTAAGFSAVTVTTIRKRNSNAALYEYDVSAVRA